MVALLAEGVDRNTVKVTSNQRHGASPSSRRAWIEILEQLVGAFRMFVALLAEGVDRNTPRSTIWLNTPASPSSRRAWIEMSM